MSEVVFAITMFRDEADVARRVLQHLISERVDSIIVADNGSTDGTRTQLEGVKASTGIPIEIVDDTEPGYWQAKKMTALAAKAAERGASWIIPFDADELWCGVQQPLADFLRSLPADVSVVGVPTFRFIEASTDDWEQGNPFLRITNRLPNPSGQFKCCYRWAPGLIIGMGNHQILKNGKVIEPLPAPEGARICHFPYRGFEHFVRKVRNGAAAYRAAEGMPENFGRHWRGWGRMLEHYGVDALRTFYFMKFFLAEPWDSEYVREQAPWCKWA